MTQIVNEFTCDHCGQRFERDVNNKFAGHDWHVVVTQPSYASGVHDFCKAVCFAAWIEKQAPRPKLPEHRR